MNLIERLKLDEDFSATAYLCPAGKQTIGYGRNIDPSDGVGITEDEALVLLENDVAVCERDLQKFFGSELWGTMGDVRRDALINMRFQLGMPRFKKFKLAIAAIRRRKWTKAGVEILDSRYAAQVPSRAQRIAAEVTTGTN